MKDKYKLKIIYMIILSIFLFFFVKLFVFLLITDVNIFDVMGFRIGCTGVRHLRHSTCDFSDFREFGRRIEIEEPFESVSVDWYKGNIRIRFSDEAGLPYAEIKNSSTDIVYKNSGGVLNITDKRTKMRLRTFLRIADCDLEVVLPSSYALSGIYISSVSGDIRLKDIHSHTVTLSSINSNVSVGGYIEKIYINTVNGNMEIKSQGGLKRVSLQAVNSNIRLLVPAGQKVRAHNSSLWGTLKFINKDVAASGSDEEAVDVTVNSVNADITVNYL